MLPLIIIGTTQAAEKYIFSLPLISHISPNSLIKILPEKEEITISQIRILKKDLSISYPEVRTIIFYDFDKSASEVQNALLKTLEEMSDKNYFIMISQNPEAILPTIRSRSKVLRLTKQKEENIFTDFYPLIEDSISSSTYSFLANPKLERIQKEDAIRLCDAVLFYFEKKLISEPAKIPSILEKTIVLRKLLEVNNINPPLAIDNLLIFINKAFKMKKE